MKKINEYISVATEAIVQFATQSSEKLTCFFKNKFVGYSYLAIFLFLLFQALDIYYTIQLGLHTYHLIHELHFLPTGINSYNFSELLFILFEVDSNSLNMGHKIMGEKVKVRKVSFKESIHRFPKLLLYVFVVMTAASYFISGQISLSLLLHDIYYTTKEVSIQKLAHSQLDTIDEIIRKVGRFTENLFGK